MLHLYDNGEGELVAADTVEDARAWYDAQAGEPSDPADWWQWEDEEEVTIRDDEESGERTKTAGEWAAACRVVTQVASTYP